MADRAPLPYDFMPTVPSFTVTSEDIAHGEMLGSKQLFNGMGGYRREPLTAAGVVRLPRRDQVLRGHLLRPRRADRLRVLALAGDRPARIGHVAAGRRGGWRARCPADAFHVRNDFGTKDFGGAAPPPGDEPHRYVFAVHAVDVETLGIDSDVSPGRRRVQPAVPHDRPRGDHPGLRALGEKPAGAEAVRLGAAGYSSSAGTGVPPSASLCLSS